MSDPTAIAGFDCTFDVAPHIPRLNPNVGKAVGRYYSFSSWKNLTKAEAVSLSEAGIEMWAIWEADGNNPASFTGENGARHAAAAAQMASDLGQPQGSGIYFAVDFDPAPPQIADLMSYFHAIAGTIGKRWRIGVYGSGDVCAAMKRNDLAALTMLAGAGGWSGSAGYEDWNIHQYPPALHPTLHLEVDPCICRGDFGGFMVTPVASAVQLPELAMGSGDAANVELLQKKLIAKGFNPGAVDGIFGRATWTALTRFQSSAGLDMDGIAGPLTWAALG